MRHFTSSRKATAPLRLVLGDETAPPAAMIRPLTPAARLGRAKRNAKTVCSAILREGGRAYYCTLRATHRTDHEAHAGRGIVVRRWPRGDAGGSNLTIVRGS